MILKNLTRKNGSTGQLIKYVLRYALDEKKQKVTTEPTLLLKHNITSRNIEDIIKEFKQNEKNRVYKRSNQVTLHHSILSWSNIDSPKITTAMLRDMAKKYIHLRAPNALCVAAVHTDREHTHLHCVFSGTYLNGKAHRLSKEQFGHLKLALDSYQKERYPQLEHSLPEHGKKSTSRDKIMPDISIAHRQPQKQSLLTALSKAYTQAYSQADFLTRVQKEGCLPYYRGKEQKLTGVTIQGRNYRFKTLGISLDALSARLDTRITSLEALRAIRTRVQGKEKSNEYDSLERVRTRTPAKHPT